MTSTPVSINNDSLNGSWIDITNASPLGPPAHEESSLEFLNYPTPAPNSPSTGPVQQNIGLISFQVERFLQEARGNQSTVNNNNNITSTPPPLKALLTNQPPTNPPQDDNISGIYASDASDVSIENLGTKAILETLKQQQHLINQKRQQQLEKKTGNDNHIRPPPQANLYHHQQHHQLDLSKSQESFGDFQLSDSLSFISRLSGLEVDYTGNCFGCCNEADLPGDHFDWLWDWSWQPEFFSGQEWKVCTPKQDYLMRQRQLYGASNNNNNHHHHYHHTGANLFSSDMISLLFLTNILSIIIGAGITYNILMRKSNL